MKKWSLYEQFIRSANVENTYKKKKGRKQHIEEYDENLVKIQQHQYTTMLLEHAQTFRIRCKFGSIYYLYT